MILDEIPRRNARRYPDKTALVFDDMRYTFREFNDRVNGLATALSDIGLRKGDKLAVLAGSCHQYIEIFFTAAKMGLVTAPLNPWLSQRELSHLINNAEASTLIFSQDNRGLVDSLRPELREVKNLIVIGTPEAGLRSYEELISSYPSLEPRTEIDDDDLLFLAPSSGTTGLPKQVMHTHKSLLGLALSILWAFNIRHEDVCLFAMPPFWALAIPFLVVSHFYMGSTVVLTKEITHKQILEAIAKEKVTTTFFGSPFLLELVGYPELDKYERASLRFVGVGGAPLPTEVWEKAIKTFGNIFGQLYGLAELFPITFLPPEDFAFEGPPERVRRLRSCGKETINIEARVVDEEGNDVPTGEAGEVIARGEGMMRGYWKAPQATEAAIKGGYVYTGDLATVDDDGYIYLMGRRKDVIVSQGKTISPVEIEDIIYHHPSVQEAAVIGVPDESLGEAIKAVIILKEGEKATAEELLRLCQNDLPDYAVPHSVDFVDTFPKSAVGKVLKHVLRDQYAKG